MGWRVMSSEPSLVWARSVRELSWPEGACACGSRCGRVFHSQSPQMVFSAYQLTKEPSVMIGQTDEQRLGCLSVCPDLWPCCARACVYGDECVSAKVTSLAGELMKTSVLVPGQISTSVNVRFGDWQSNTLGAHPPSFWQKKMEFIWFSRLLLRPPVVLLVRAQWLHAVCCCGFWDDIPSIVFFAFKASC